MQDSQIVSLRLEAIRLAATQNGNLINTAQDIYNYLVSPTINDELSIANTRIQYLEGKLTAAHISF